MKKVYILINMQRHVSAIIRLIVALKTRLHSRILRVTINLMMAMNWPKHVVIY